MRLHACFCPFETLMNLAQRMRTILHRIFLRFLSIFLLFFSSKIFKFSTDDGSKIRPCQFFEFFFLFPTPRIVFSLLMMHFGTMLIRYMSNVTANFTLKRIMMRCKKSFFVFLEQPTGRGVAEEN